MIPGELVSILSRRRLVAEIRTETAVQALGVVDALAAGGITAMEVSLAIPGAQEILAHLALRQDTVIGAGAVLDAQQAREAISAGARFIASPVCNPELVPVCRDARVACVLGALTPTEVYVAHRAGAEMVKLFPVEEMGGARYVRSLARQMPQVGLQIAGAVQAEELGEYLRLPVRTVCLGTLLVPPVLVERGNWQALTARARTFLQYALNPHAYAAQFLAAASASPQPGAPERLSYGPRAALAAVPTMPTPEGSGALAEAALGQIEQPFGLDDGDGQAENAYGRAPVPRPAGASADDFKPWDSRPVKLGDEEDWLR